MNWYVSDPYLPQTVEACPGRPPRGLAPVQEGGTMLVPPSAGGDAACTYAAAFAAVTACAFDACTELQVQHL